jgi:hypothetical protein
MHRKETYSTTGSRIVVRFFGGWDFEKADADSREPAVLGYTKGVPMGGDMHAAGAGKAPTFLTAAMKDPLSGNLDRIQIIKGWLDAKGDLHEKVYDVAWSGDRKAGADWLLGPAAVREQPAASGARIVPKIRVREVAPSRSIMGLELALWRLLAVTANAAPSNPLESKVSHLRA